MIVSDSTTIMTLINIDEFDLLKFFKTEIVIPKNVYLEVSTQVYGKNFLDNQIAKGFIKIKKYQNKGFFKELNTFLDKGESSAIVLAKELNLPLIIDEKKGRKIAQRYSIKIIGLIGIIRYLYLENKIDKRYVINLIEKLNQSNFRITKKLLDMILEPL